MNTFIAGMALLSAFIALHVIEYLPTEMDKRKASLVVGMIYLLCAIGIYLGGIFVTLLEFNS